MATLLADGGFEDEATTPLAEATAFGVRALAIAADCDLDPAIAYGMSATELVERGTVAALLPPGTVAALEAAGPIDKARATVQQLLAAAQTYG